MKILVACRTMDNVAGGVERMAVALMHAMKSRGHEISLLTRDRWQARSFYPIDPEISWQKLDLGGPDAGSSFTKRLARLSKIRRIIRRKKPDVIVAFQHGQFLAVRAAVTGLGIPVIAAERNAPHRFDYIREGKYKNLIMNSFRLACRITVQCESYREKYPESVQHRIEVIPNPVFPSESCADPAVSRDNNDKILLSVGRLGYQKNMEVLLQAFNLLLPVCPGWRLVIAGEGEDREKLENYIKEHDLAQAANLPGAIGNMDELYCNSHLFCLPSRWEGFPNAIAEAMARNLPVVGFAGCAGTSDLIEHNRTGLLAPGNGDPQSLARTLRTAMENEDLRVRLGTNARNEIKKYEPEKIFDNWETLFEKVRN